MELTKINYLIYIGCKMSLLLLFVRFNITNLMANFIEIEV